MEIDLLESESNRASITKHLNYSETENAEEYEIE